MLEQTESLEARRSWKLYLFLFRFPLFGLTIYLVAELLEWHWELITLPTLTLPSTTTCLPSSSAVFLKSISLLSGRITISVLTELIREERMQMSVIFAGRGMMGFGQISSTEMVSTILLVTVIHQLISSPSWPNQFPVDQFLTTAPVCVCVCECISNKRATECLRSPCSGKHVSILWLKICSLHNPEISKYLVKDVRQKWEERKCLS